MRKPFLAIFILFMGVFYGACGHKESNVKREKVKPKTETFSIEKDCARLEKLLETSEMKTYVDTTYNVAVPYPEFFEIHTLEPGTARFYYKTFDFKPVYIVMFVEPNIEGWDIKEATINLSDSANICIALGEDFFIMSGPEDSPSGGCFLEKCFLIDGNWVDYAVYYYQDYINAIGPLLTTVLEWAPRPGMGRPRRNRVG